MEKIKINLMSGSALEKPVVTAFKSNGGEYVVLDNEMNGTMGLPIILVSKLVNNTLTLIPDAEWNSVKERLRLIISGNQVDYIKVGEMLGAEDMFFKQLTLPVASFEALKNNYRPVDATTAAPVQQTIQNTPLDAQTIPNINPLNNSMSNQNVNPANNVNSDLKMPASNLEQPIITPVMPTAPETNQVISPVSPVAPIEPVAPVAKPVTPTPTVEPITETDNTPVDFTADKEAFLKACENMFDALVAKFNNK